MREKITNTHENMFFVSPLFKITDLKIIIALRKELSICKQVKVYISTEYSNCDFKICINCSQNLPKKLQITILLKRNVSHFSYC